MKNTINVELMQQNKLLVKNNLKKCKDCQEIKPLSSFRNNAQGIGNKDCYCSLCSNKRSNMYYHKTRKNNIIKVNFEKKCFIEKDFGNNGKLDAFNKIDDKIKKLNKINNGTVLFLSGPVSGIHRQIKRYENLGFNKFLIVERDLETYQQIKNHVKEDKRIFVYNGNFIEVLKGLTFLKEEIDLIDYDTTDSFNPECEEIIEVFKQNIQIKHLILMGHLRNSGINCKKSINKYKLFYLLKKYNHKKTRSLKLVKTIIQKSFQNNYLCAFSSYVSKESGPMFYSFVTKDQIKSKINDFVWLNVA